MTVPIHASSFRDGTPIKVGEVAALFRYPVKSMRGELLEFADVGWHGLEGDRRLALRRIGDRGGFPWLTATRLPELILYAPQHKGNGAQGSLPTHVRTPSGAELDVFGDELIDEIRSLHGSPIEMTHLSRGIFDEASISVIGAATADEIGRLAAERPDVRRFRPNVVIRSDRAVAFEEDQWVGSLLRFGETDDAVTVGITNHDERCAMVNLDPDTAHRTPEVLKAIARERDNRAGVYGTVTRRGRVEVGQAVFLVPLT